MGKREIKQLADVLQARKRKECIERRLANKISLIKVLICHDTEA